MNGVKSSAIHLVIALHSFTQITLVVVLVLFLSKQKLQEVDHIVNSLVMEQIKFFTSMEPALICVIFLISYSINGEEIFASTPVIPLKPFIMMVLA